MKSKLGYSLQRYALSLLFVLVVGVLFKPLWWDGMLLGFRDTLHFYYPLWSFVDRLPWPDRLLPIWNPLDAFGCSIVGEPTSMVFYPFRFVLIVPIGTIEQRIGVFFVIHLWLAYGTWCYAGCKLGLKSKGVQLTGWAYALSGPVFFQIYNPPFLIGAAWLPLAMFGLLKILHIDGNDDSESSISNSLTANTPTLWESLFRDISPIGFLVLSLSMMVLGGDAQSAYHVAIICGLVTCCVLGQLRGTYQNSTRQCFRHLFHWTVAIGIAFVLAYGLTAIQSFPTYHWLSISERFGPVEATSESNLRRLLGIAYSFSVTPWEYTSMLVPNIFGHLFPTLTRWMNPFGAETSIWSPSLHVGSLVIAGAIAWWTTRLRSRLSVVSILIVFIALLSSLGRYSLYDVWNAILPGYSQFRYPAKWTTFLVWGICFAATAGITSLEDLRIRKSVSRVCCLIAVLGSVAASLNLIIYFSSGFRAFVFDSLMSSAKKNGITMDIDFSQAAYLIGLAGFLCVATSVAAIIVLRWKRRPQMFVMLCGISIVELLVALQPMLTYVRPVTVDPFPHFQSEVSTVWNPSTKGVKVGSIDEQLRERGIKKAWTFGDMNLPVLGFIESTIDRKVNEPWDIAELQAVKQGDQILGKLHLLRNFRSFQTFYSLGPKMLGGIRTTVLEQHLDPQEHAREIPGDYFIHHVSSIANPPTWPPASRSDPLTEKITFDQVLMESNLFKFQYDSPEEFYLQLPILNDGGWSLIERPVDSQIEKSPDDLLILRLPAGSNKISLRFVPPRFVVGCLISIVSICLILTAVMLNRLSPSRSSLLI